MAMPRILVIAGSLRPDSLNARLAGAALRELALANVDVTHLSLADFPLPLYDAEDEARTGFPPHAVNLKRQLGAHRGVFIASPEYNASVSPLLKNTIDWMSRVRERGDDPLGPFHDRVFALGAASPEQFGGLRGLMALRQILELGCGATVIARQVTIAHADRAFDETDRLKGEGDAEALRLTLRGLIDAVQRMT